MAAVDSRLLLTRRPPPRPRPLRVRRLRLTLLLRPVHPPTPHPALLLTPLQQLTPLVDQLILPEELEVALALPTLSLSLLLKES